MKARVLLEVGAYERFVIAKYFRVAPETRKDRTRTRATRQQVRRFTQAALRAMVAEQAGALRGRERAAAKRLAEPTGKAAADELIRPDERQPGLAW